MKQSLLKIPKRKKSGFKKTETSRAKITKKKVLVFIITALILLIVLTGSGIAGDFLKEKIPAGEKAETAELEQPKENEQSEVVELGDMKDRLAYDFISTLKGDAYLIRYKTTTVYQGTSYEVETTYAVSGDSTALASTDRATIVKGNKVYMLNHTDKTIISWNVGQSDNLKRIETEGLAYVGSSKEGGLLCEEYAAAQTEIKISFSGNDLKKVATRINRQAIVMDIIEVSKEVPDDLFVVPNDYRITDLS